MGEGEVRGPARMARLRNSVRVELKVEASQEQKGRFKVEHVVKEVLQGMAGQQPSSVLCLQDFSSNGFMDITFGDMTTCLGFVSAWEKKPQHPAIGGMKLRALYMWEDVPLTVHMYNPFVDESDIKLFLRRFCLKVEGGQKVTNSFGIWTGRRKYEVRFRPDAAAPGGVVQLPASFSIGPHRGFLFYPGQPVTCRRCGEAGHTRASCTGKRCRFCGSEEHGAVACTAPKKCSLCGHEDHLYRDCTLKRRSFASLFSEDTRRGEEERLAREREGKKNEGQTSKQSLPERAGKLGPENKGESKEEGNQWKQGAPERPHGKEEETVGEVEATEQWGNSPFSPLPEPPEWAAGAGKRPFPGEEDEEEEQVRRARTLAGNRFTALREEMEEEEEQKVVEEDMESVESPQVGVPPQAEVPPQPDQRGPRRRRTEAEELVATNPYVATWMRALEQPENRDEGILITGRGREYTVRNLADILRVYRIVHGE